MNPNRRFVYEIIGMGFELQSVTPDDVLEHVTPEVLAHHLPVALKAKLLQASLKAERMTPALVVEAIGLEPLVENAPLPALWECIRGAVQRQLGATPERAAAPSVGVGASNGGADSDLGLKPPKSTRPVTTMRPPSRVSALSPRSRIGGGVGPSSGLGLGLGARGRDEGTAPLPSDSGSMSEVRGEPPIPEDSSRDFEIIEETDVARGRGNAVSPDEDTRHGSKS